MRFGLSCLGHYIAAVETEPVFNLPPPGQRRLGPPAADRYSRCRCRKLGGGQQSLLFIERYGQRSAKTIASRGGIECVRGECRNVMGCALPLQDRRSFISQRDD